MIHVIDDKETISKLQKQFDQQLKSKFSYPVYGKERDRGYKLSTAKLHYSSEHDFWFSSKYEIENRYCNFFGVGQSLTGFTNKTTIEICIPKENINRRIAGIFGRDDDGNFYVMHRGIIGGGIKGLTKDLFMREYGGKFEFVQDGEKRTSRVAVIACIDSDELVKQIADFVKEVSRIKTDLQNRKKNNEITP